MRLRFPAVRMSKHSAPFTITYYLANQKEIDIYLTDQEESFEKLKLDLRETAPLLWQIL